MVQESSRLTVLSLNRMKAEGERVAALSIYDFAFAKIAARAGIDIIVIGDSLGNTLLGYGSTLPVTMDQMITFASAACRGAGGIFTVGDMPLGSYQTSCEEAVRNALRFIKEAGCAAVKCEASMKLLSRFKAIADAEILVMGHIGLNPQKIHEMGGYRIQGKTVRSTMELLETAHALKEAGAFSLLLEGVTEEVAGMIRDEVKELPVYGIGSGRYVDGQLLIGHDPLGLYDWGDREPPKYIKYYRPGVGGKTIGELVFDVYSQYIQDVKKGIFPAEENVHHVTLHDFERAAADEKGAAQILQLIRMQNK